MKKASFPCISQATLSFQSKIYSEKVKCKKMLYSAPAIFVFAFITFTSPAACRKTSLRHHSQYAENESFNEVLDDEDKRMALLHSQRVSAASKCEIPRPQVIHVNDHYPGKYYLPHCTILHRCGKHAGCCAVESLKCVAAEKEKVLLYFYSVKFDDDELTERKIEKLVFTNHTRCACAPVE